MALNFNQYAIEANIFLKDYAKELNIKDDLDKAGRILSAILHGLRELISTEESIQLIAQFPMFLKAAYVNSWSSKSKKRKVKHMEEFIDLVRIFDGVTSIYDFESNEVAEHYINTTFFVLRKYISRGEMEDIRDELPKNLKDMIFNRSIF